MLKPTTRPQFAFIGGHPVLDFVNSLHGRLGEQPFDLLDSHDSLRDWVTQASWFVWHGVAVIGLVVLCQAPIAHAQTDAEMVESEDTHYYDFWPGTWVEIVNGRPDTSATTFTVRRSVHAAAFEEDWRQVYDGSSHRSAALRAWDQVANRWMFTWVSDNALFQVWEGKKVGGHWYIFRQFLINGETVLSRQAWIPEAENRLTRMLERSTDGGHTWTTRYRTTFERVSR